MVERNFCFVGEEPSKKATDNGWTWEDGRLSAKQLRDALEDLGLSFEEQWFTNLFDPQGKVDPESVERIYAAISAGLEVVAMGSRVDISLGELGIMHLRICHPAARGKIRAKRVYQEHVGAELGL